jgi:hypothetical protein
MKDLEMVIQSRHKLDFQDMLHLEIIEENVFYEYMKQKWKEEEKPKGFGYSINPYSLEEEEEFSGGKRS